MGSRIVGRVALFVVAVAAWAPAVRAQPAPAGAPRVAPFVDDATVFVARIDVAALDLDAAGKWATDLMRNANAPADAQTKAADGLADGLPQAKAALAEFRRAGVKTVWFSARFAPQPVLFLAVPVEAGGDAKKIGELVRSAVSAMAAASGQQPGAPADPATPFGNPRAEVINNIVVVGNADALTAVKQMEPADRADVEQALAAGGGTAAVRMALAPTAILRLGLATAMPKLPAELGGGPVAPVSNGTRWAALAVDPPPHLSVRAVVQARDAVVAEQLRGIVAAGVKQMKLPDGAAGEQIRAALAPAVAGDQLKLTLDTPKITDLMATLVPIIKKAKDDAAAATTTVAPPPAPPEK